MLLKNAASGCLLGIQTELGVGFRGAVFSATAQNTQQRHAREKRADPFQALILFRNIAGRSLEVASALRGYSPANPLVPLE
jgi:hypothetical protein